MPQAWFSHFYLLGMGATYMTLHLDSRSAHEPLQVPQVPRCSQLAAHGA